MDRYLYKTRIQSMLREQPHLMIREAHVHGLALAWCDSPQEGRVAHVTGVLLRT